MIANRVGSMAARLAGGSWFDAAIRSLRPARDLEDDHEAVGFVDEVDDPEVAEPKPPELGVGQLGGTCRVRVEGQCEDRGAKARGVPGRETS